LLIHDIQMSILLEVGSLLAPQYSRFRNSGPTHFLIYRVEQFNFRRAEFCLRPLAIPGHLWALWTLQEPAATLAGSVTGCTVLQDASGRHNVSGSVMCVVVKIRWEQPTRRCELGVWWKDRRLITGGPVTARQPDNTHWWKQRIVGLSYPDKKLFVLSTQSCSQTPAHVRPCSPFRLWPASKPAFILL
jgi:hypothetical protein